MDAVAAVRGAGNDAADDDDLVVPFLHDDGEVALAQEVFLELRQLLVVRGEERARAALDAVAYDVNGLCIEAQVERAKGSGDDPKQAVSSEALKNWITQARQLCVLRR